LDAELLQRSWKIIKEARAALALPKPSTFLGNGYHPPQEQPDQE
jgi:hypothetical protein